MNKYISRKTKDACGIDRNSLLNNGEFMGDFIMKSDADKVAEMLNEHTALVAVAEAASKMFYGCGLQDYQRAGLAPLLATLATVRAGSGVAK